MNEAPASLLGFEYQALIDDISKKSVGFQTTVDKDCSQEALDRLLDKCRIAVDRQRVFAQIEAKSIDLRNLEEGLSRAHQEIEFQDKQFAKRADEHGGRAARVLSASEQKDRQAKIEALKNGTVARDSIAEKIDSLRSMV